MRTWRGWWAAAILLALFALPGVAHAQNNVGNFKRVVINGTNVSVGSGSPEASVTGAVGDVYIRTNGTIYTKTSGSGNTGWTLLTSGGGGGTVTSLNVTFPGIFSASGGPVTTSGTISASLVTQSANRVWAGPTTGSPATPTFRQVVFGDWASNSCATGQIPKYDGAAWVCDDDAGASSGAPSAAPYLTMTTDATLLNERVITAGTGITATDAGAGSTLTLAVDGPAVTGVPISTGISGLGIGVATFLATPSSANLATAVTGETGSGALVFGTSPTLTTPALGTPTALTLTSATGLPLTGLVAASDDQTIVSSGAAFVAKTLPSCTDTGGNHLNYDQSTNTFSCGTSGGGGGGGGTVYWQPPSGLRLSLTTNTYLTATDVTGATTVYWTPIVSGGHGTVTCYNGASLEQQSVTQKSIALGTLTSGKNYNVYWDCDGAALALGAAWTTDTTPSETIDDQDGAQVLSTDHTKLYLGIFRTTSTTATEDSQNNRFVWNLYNRAERAMVNATETTDSWNYSTATFRQANANTANELRFIVGAIDQGFSARVYGLVSNNVNGTGMTVGVGVNSTSANSATTHGAAGSNTIVLPQLVTYDGYPRLGYNFIAWLEYANGATGTFYGDAALPAVYQSGITGTIRN